MPTTADDILGSVALITGTDSNNFGTGFVIHRQQDETWIVTCAHVVEKVGGIGKIQVDDQPAKIVACGTRQTVDLAVLKVQGLDKPPLKLGLAGRRDITCHITGYANLDPAAKLKKAEPLTSHLGNQVRFKVPGHPESKAWKLWIDGKTLLEEGYSGSPVTCASTGTVIAVVSDKEYQGKRGYAVSLVHLRDIWLAMPPELFAAGSAVQGWITGEQRRLLENLFQQLPVANSALRDWCHKAMPPNQPHELPADANALDLLEWLIERGQLADRQVPLLRVLRKLLPRLDAASHDQLVQCIQQIAHHFGITAIKDIPEDKAGAIALIVAILPNAASGNRCDVQGWLFSPPDHFPLVCTRENETAVKLDDSENLVEELLAQLRNRWVDENRMMIEFAFPRQLLSHPAEQWCSSADEPLGFRWPVVVRPWERLRQDPSPAYRNRWAMLNAADRILLSSLWWFEKQYWRKVQGKLAEGRCIVCGFVPDPLAEPREHDLDYLLSEYEIPIALWPRRPADCPADFCEATLQKALASDLPPDLAKLPMIIHKMRQKLFEDEQENMACYHLTLLWDDPNRRLPKDEFYQAPV